MCFSNNSLQNSYTVMYYTKLLCLEYILKCYSPLPKKNFTEKTGNL